MWTSWWFFLGEGGLVGKGGRGAYDGTDSIFVEWVPAYGHYHWVDVAAFLGLGGGGCGCGRVSGGVEVGLGFWRIRAF